VASYQIEYVGILVVFKDILVNPADSTKAAQEIHFVAQAPDGFAMHPPVIWRLCAGFIE
jgi:hypothetical protein